MFFKNQFQLPNLCIIVMKALTVLWESFYLQLNPFISYKSVIDFAYRFHINFLTKSMFENLQLAICVCYEFHPCLLSIIPRPHIYQPSPPLIIIYTYPALHPPIPTLPSPPPQFYPDCTPSQEKYILRHSSFPIWLSLHPISPNPSWSPPTSP